MALRQNETLRPLDSLLNMCPESFQFPDQFRHPESHFPAPAVSPGQCSHPRPAAAGSGGQFEPWVTLEAARLRRTPRRVLPVWHSEGPG